MDDRTSAAIRSGSIAQDANPPRPTEPVDATRLVRIYLDDHWAGAGAGVALAKRLATHNETTPWHAELRRIAAAIEDDQRVLSTLRDAHGRSPRSLKRALAKVAERVGRLKLNGRLIGYSPLSRLVEVELLMSGVQGKRNLWSALRYYGAPTADVDWDMMERRSIEQLEQLARIHDQAAQIAFGDESAGDPRVPQPPDVAPSPDPPTPSTLD